jgi:hypothetical protein
MGTNGFYQDFRKNALELYGMECYGAAVPDFCLHIFSVMDFKAD